MKKNYTGLQGAVLTRFAIIFVLLVVLMFSSVNNINSVRSTKDATGEIYVQIQDLNMAFAKHQEWARGLLESFTLGSTFTGGSDPNACALGTFLNSSSVAGNPLYSELVAKAVPAHVRIHEAGVSISSMTAAQYDQAVTMYQNTIVVELATISAAITTQESLLQTELSRLDNALESEINVALFTTLICVAVVAIVCVTTIVYLKTKVADPLTQISAETAKLAQGNLELTFDRSSDAREIANLSDALNFSVGELRRMIGEIDNNVEELAKKNYTVYPSMSFPGEFRSIEESLGNLINGIRGTFTEINITTSQVETASDQFTTGSQLLADGSTEQAASVEELSATVTSMTTNMDESVRNARSANELGKSAAELMEQSSVEMHELMGAIKEIEEAAASINNIIKTINDIASQTNILALNAAVEAARAGESGKGFAVVADEVRNLAQKSAEAVKNTTKQIETCLESVAKGANLASHTNESFTEMQGNVTEVIELITHVAFNLEEQNSSLANFAVGMDQISAVVQTNTATSEETASTSIELNSQVKNLNGLVSEFKIKEKGLGSTSRYDEF